MGSLPLPRHLPPLQAWTQEVEHPSLAMEGQSPTTRVTPSVVFPQEVLSQRALLSGPLTREMEMDGDESKRWQEVV